MALSHNGTIPLLIASFLEPNLVAQIERVHPKVRVIYEPALLPKQRYAADHTGPLPPRSLADETRWRTYLGQAQIMFDFDRAHAHDLPDLAPNVRWLQATSAGVGTFISANAYHVRMPETIFTTASGVHAIPLAEFCSMAMLMASRGFFLAARGQRAKHWQRFAGTDLVGRTLVIVGLGRIGQQVARHAQAFGMNVIGVKRNLDGIDLTALSVNEILPVERLSEALPHADFLALIAPHTPETEGLMDRAAIRKLPRGSFIVNIGRGALIDEEELVRALEDGHLAGAALDVFATEPLPESSPLWTFNNVIIFPHSAGTSDRENERITDLFCDNLRRYFDGQPLRNVFDTSRMY